MIAAEITEESCLLAEAPFALWLVFGQHSFIARNYLPRGGTAHSGLNPPTLIRNQDNSIQSWPQANLT